MKLYKTAITALRFVLSAWIGAAVLYVITSVAEQTSPDFDSVMRDQLATIRFPLYYKFGFACYIVAGALAAVLCAPGRPEARRRSWLVLALIVFSAGIYVWDYFFVYAPLQDLITPPGQARTQEFVRLHTMSRNANVAHLLVMMVAAIIASVPGRTPDLRQADD